MKFGTSYGTSIEIQPGEVVGCIQIGHTYETHPVTEHCLYPHPVSRACGEARCTCSKRAVK